jgi:hypothetical protein
MSGHVEKEKHSKLRKKDLVAGGSMRNAVGEQYRNRGHAPVKKGHEPSITPTSAHQLPQGTQTGHVATRACDSNYQSFHPVTRDKPLVFVETASSVPRIIPGVSNPILTIGLLVGTQDQGNPYLTTQLFQVPIGLLRHTNMSARLQHFAASGVPRTSVVRLPDLDPNALQLYLEYVSTGDVSFPKSVGITRPGREKLSWVACWPLINAHRVSTVLDDEDFARFIIRLLQKKIYRPQIVDPETLHHVFRAAGPDPLKQLVVDEAIECGLDNFDSTFLARCPTPFILMALEIVIEKLKLDVLSRMENDWGVDAGILGADPIKMRRIRDRLKIEKMSRDFRQSKTEVDGVKTVDWTNDAPESSMPEANRQKTKEAIETEVS